MRPAVRPWPKMVRQSAVDSCSFRHPPNRRCMIAPESSTPQRIASPNWPTHTHWSVVLASADPAAPDARNALEALCRAYWYPVYSYVRRRGHARPDAEDLTQAFFLRLLETHALKAATPERGRFRAFLRASVDHFMVSEWRRENALKRGGGITFLSWEGLRAEDRYAREAVCELTPERLFERSWAYTLLQRSLDRLKGELAAADGASLFDALKGRLLGEVGAEPYADLAPRLGTTVSAVKKTVERLRGRYGEIVRREIAQTVASLDEIDDELRHLLVMVSG